MTIDTSQEAVERLLDGVTPGPWQSDAVFMDRDHEVRVAMPDDCGVPMATIAEAFHNWNDITDVAERRISWKEAEANASFIAAARELVPALLARAEAAEAREQALLTSYDEERKALVENTSLRERLKAAEELLQFISKVAPVADKTCDEPGITFVEACRREMKDRGK